MLKKWIAAVLAVALCAGAVPPLGAEENRIPAAGKQMIVEVEASYQKGDYDVFLEQLHEQYQRAGKAGVLRGVFESAKAALPQDTEESRKAYRAQMAELDKERNKRLLEATTDSKETAISQKVAEIASFNLPSEHAEILAELDSLKYKVPKTAEATVQNKISALEIEYYIKSLLLDIAGHKSGSSPEELNKKKIALVLKKLDTMEAVAKEFNDEIWIKKIEIAKGAYRADKAYRMDLDVLNSLAVGKIDPENPVEEKVKGIMIDFLSQRSTQADQHLAELAQK